MAKKDPFADVHPDLKEQLQAADDVEIRKKVSEFALYRQAQKEAMKEDPDVQQKSEELAYAKADYKAAIKAAELNIEYAKFLLESRGTL